jgi:hypothetical protein
LLDELVLQILEGGIFNAQDFETLLATVDRQRGREVLVC